MTDLPYVVVSCCISMDGYLDGAGPLPLRLSNDADLERVDRVRAGSDAILVGARTVRRDDPRLLVRSPGLRARRVDAGLPPSPMKVTVTASGQIDAASRFCTAGDTDRVVYAATPVVATVRRRLTGLATVVDAGRRPTMPAIAEDLAVRGVHRLMVEGGGEVLTQLLTAGLADELLLAIAPVFVGDERGSRFVGSGRFPWTASSRAELVETRSIGDVGVLRYALSARFRLDPEPRRPVAERLPAGSSRSSAPDAPRPVAPRARNGEAMGAGAQ
jgi:5-amino-6-(5-phosphoribosylamino)uracil reductase